ncbi:MULTISPECIES: phosphoglucosamine mutase [Thioalkalivibrio]|uniref:Phosphoglucosamine mutase n=1 Tax=Thioalkalivibrio versutus TaxID=106634 RepID=A0A0G3G4R4_9GAMM|nr:MULTISPECIES: phosphoglucosamine mutase [Thioalkalivibrio]AKJ94502.1 phosphoglucosamine mutase [Thioalkalivibrio versutus]OOC48146.1 phosphoglucosamine mutase [Thioalkalivibrio versutus]
MGKYFGTDGIRGRTGDWPMTPEFALRLGYAVGEVLGENGHRQGPVLVGKDTRVSGYMFESALEAGLSAAGLDVALLGPMPTPAIAYLTHTFRATAGVVISASHNPFHDNGFKFFTPEGDKLPDATEAAIEARLDQPAQPINSARLGKAVRIQDAAGRYVEFCKSAIPARSELRGMKIVIDCAHGATYNVSPHVFEELGAQVEILGASPDGYNINDGVGALHPENVAEQVRATGADLGIALDGDGDRVILADADGTVVDGDQILGILALARQQAGGFDGGVVGTLMTNLGLEQALGGAGIPFVRAKVGDRYVLEELRRRDWTLGGEGSGHIVCLEHTTTGDGTVAALQVAHLMHRTGQPLSALAAAIPKLPQCLINVPVSGAAAGCLEAEPVRAEVAAVEDQLGQRGRVLLRPSGTEPLVRVMVEGEDVDETRSAAERIADSIRAAI